MPKPQLPNTVEMGSQPGATSSRAAHRARYLVRAAAKLDIGLPVQSASGCRHLCPGLMPPLMFTECRLPHAADGAARASRPANSRRRRACTHPQAIRSVAVLLSRQVLGKVPGSCPRNALPGEGALGGIPTRLVELTAPQRAAVEAGAAGLRAALGGVWEHDGTSRAVELIALRRHNIDLKACEIRIVQMTAQLDSGALLPETPPRGTRKINPDLVDLLEVDRVLTTDAVRDQPSRRSLVCAGIVGMRLPAKVAQRRSC